MNSIIIHRFVGELADLYINAYIISAGFRTNEALCQLSYEAPFLGPEGGKTLYSNIIMSGIALKQNTFKFKIAPHKQKSIVKKNCLQEDEPLGQRGPVHT